MKETLVEIEEGHPDFTLDQINAQLRMMMPEAPRVSRTAISNALKNHLIVVKTLRNAHAERNNDRTKERRQAFANWLMTNMASMSFIVVDETGTNSWTRRSRRRARSGEKEIRVVAGRRGSTYTMTFAVSPTVGLVHHDLQLGVMKGEKAYSSKESSRSSLYLDLESRHSKKTL